MDPRRFLFPIFSLDAEGNPEALRGNAFPITSDGGLLTCRHVIDGGSTLVIMDRELAQVCPIGEVTLPDDNSLDLAFLPRALGRKSHRFPLLAPGDLLVGHDVYSYGWYSPSGRVETATDGYFKGNVVSFRTNRHITVTLSYPVIEGMSGSPVLLYHHGVKLGGICFGSETQRVLASEIVELRDGEREYRETVNRIVELGLAYRSEVIESWMAEVPGVTLAVTSGPCDLEPPDEAEDTPGGEI